MDTLKGYILNYIHHFSMYDYMAYAWLILLFFVTILLSILVARKSPLFSILVLMLSLALLFIGPFFLKQQLDKYIRPSLVQAVEVKKLQFSDSLIVTGEVQNLSKKDFSQCTIDIKVVKDSKNSVKNFINQLKPLRKKTIFMEDIIEVNATKDFRVVFDAYTYKNDINISTKSECY